MERLQLQNFCLNNQDFFIIQEDYILKKATPTDSNCPGLYSDHFSLEFSNGFAVTNNHLIPPRGDNSQRKVEIILVFKKIYCFLTHCTTQGTPL